MTKKKIRKARKETLDPGHITPDPRNDGSYSYDRGRDPVEFSETLRGRRALDKWARGCDELNGAPESDYDR